MLSGSKDVVWTVAEPAECTGEAFDALRCLAPASGPPEALISLVLAAKAASS